MPFHELQTMQEWLCGLCIFACVRTMAWDIDAALYIKRVPTKDNLADDPSRERYDLLERMEVRPLFLHISYPTGCH